MPSLFPKAGFEGIPNVAHEGPCADMGSDIPCSPEQAAADAIWQLVAPACPFCAEGGFDVPGLAWHIQNYCDAAGAAIDAQEESLRSFHDGMMRRAEDRQEAARDIGARVASPSAQSNGAKENPFNTNPIKEGEA